MKASPTLRYTLQQFEIQTYRLRRWFSYGWTADLRHALDGREGSAGGRPLPDTVIPAVSPVRSRPISCEICIGTSGIKTCPPPPMTSVLPPSLSFNQCCILIFHSSATDAVWHDVNNDSVIKYSSLSPSSIPLFQPRIVNKWEL